MRLASTCSLLRQCIAASGGQSAVRLAPQRHNFVRLVPVINARTVFGFAGAKEKTGQGEPSTRSEVMKTVSIKNGLSHIRYISQFHPPPPTADPSGSDSADPQSAGAAAIPGHESSQNPQTGQSAKVDHEAVAEQLAEAQIADVLEAAIKASDEKPSHDSVKDLMDGVKMTHRNLIKVFKKHGLIKVDPLHQMFDPNLHEALFELPPGTDDLESGKIGAILKTGYMLHERPIRPAQVAVVK